MSTLAHGSFRGLGHGICDVETGELLPMLRGVVVDVEITGVEKGRKNDPGELRGACRPFAAACWRKTRA